MSEFENENMNNNVNDVNNTESVENNSSVTPENNTVEGTGFVMNDTPKQETEQRPVDGSYGFSYGHGGYRYNDDVNVEQNPYGQSSRIRQEQTSQNAGFQQNSFSQSNFNQNASSENQQNGFGQTQGNGTQYQSQNDQYAYYWQQASAQQSQNRAQRRAARKAAKANGGDAKQHKTAKYWGKIVASAAAFGLVASLVFSGTNAITNKATGNDTKVATTVSSSDKQLGSTSTSSATTVTDVSDIASEVMPSIVQVTNVSLEQYRSFFGQSQTYQSTSAGSGIIISQDDDTIYIASNNHVVANSDQLTVTFSDDKSVSATIVGTDEQHDLAVIAVKTSDVDSSTMKEIKVATLGSSDDLIAGQSVIAIGNALGYGQSVTTGVVSATSREVSLQDDYGNTISNNLIQTDAAINPGNSGGALLNMSGEVIGVVSAKYSDTSVEGMGYAIPITQAKEIIESLIKNGSYTDSASTDSKSGQDGQSSGLTKGAAYLGIYGMDISSDTASQYNVPTGVYVSQAVEGAAAAQAGLSKGDVITKIDDTDTTDMSTLKNYIASKKAGDKVTITYADASDNYSTQTVTVELGAAE